MTPNGWRRQLGDSAWNRIRTAVPDAPDAQVATLLDRATEMGFRAPEAPPTVNLAGTRVLWPGGAASLTSAGLEAYYTARGHGFYLLRVPQMIRALAGPMLGRFQEILAMYEEQCGADGVPPLPGWADVVPFVGGEARWEAPWGEAARSAFVRGLGAECPPPTAAKGPVVPGPGASNSPA